MKKVAVVGYGNTKFTKDESPIESLLLESTKQVFDTTKNLSQDLIDGVIVSTNDNSKYLGAILSELSGIKPKISHTVEHLCSSGSTAVISGFSYIASGLADTVLVTGADKIDNPGQILEWDKSRGEYNHPIYWASMFTKAHKRQFSTTDEELAIVSAKNHKQAMDTIWISGIGQKTNSASFTKNQLTTLSSTVAAASDAYKMAKITPQEIDTAEIHDAFSVCELMAVEDLSLTERNTSASYIRNLFNTEDRKINPRGGLIGAGHPLGATGISQIVEITQQLQNNAKKRQISNVKKGLVHNMSAASTSSTVLVLES